jgi:hypothetical protein
MKGMSFQNGVEFRITIEGESWTPGSTIQGRIESKPVAKGQVYLAEGIDKKVKTKSADAFVILQEKDLTTAPYDWSFDLPIDSRISDKSGSLYLLYGHGENLEKLGQLRLNILPQPMITDLVDLLCTHFRFALKSYGAGKSGMTEVKLDPPSSKDWAMLEGLTLLCKSQASTLDCKFQFLRNEVDATKGGLSTKNVKRDIQRSWGTRQIIHDFNQRLNKDVMTAEIDKVIAEYRNAGWLSS